MNIVYSNNQVYIFDLNKMNKKVSGVENGNEKEKIKENIKEKIKEFMVLDLKTSDRFTCLNSNLI